jgi:hypothetical protein
MPDNIYRLALIYRIFIDFKYLYSNRTFKNHFDYRLAQHCLYLLDYLNSIGQLLVFEDERYLYSPPFARGIIINYYDYCLCFACVFDRGLPTNRSLCISYPKFYSITKVSVFISHWKSAIQTQ